MPMTLKLKDLLQGNCPQRALALMREAFPGDPVVGKMSAKWIANWNARRAPPPPSTKAELEKWINKLEEEQIDDYSRYCFKEFVADDGSTFLTCLFATMTAQMQRICGKRPKTNQPSPAQAPEPSPSTPSALEHARAKVSEPSPPPSPPLEHASAPVTKPSPSPSPSLEHGPAQVPKPSPSPSSPLHGPSVKSVPKDLHRKASKGDKVCAVFTHHLRTGDKGYLHWGKVLAVEGSECTIKWQTDKKPSSHSIADVFLTEATAWAAFHSIPNSDTASEAPLYPDSDHEATGPKTSLRSAAQVNSQPGTSQSREALYINKKHFDVPVGYTEKSL